MKKTCKGCRALEGFEYQQSCSLGYDSTVNVIGEFFGRPIYQAKPLETCPKPKTYDKYIELHERKGQC